LGLAGHADAAVKPAGEIVRDPRFATSALDLRQSDLLN